MTVKETPERLRLAIADPPYLGRGHRWYGGGGGSSPRWPAAANHPEAKVWDSWDAHSALIKDLVENYDGWAIAASADSLGKYLAECPEDTRVMVWYRRNAFPSGWRVTNSWEPVLIHIPLARRSRNSEGFRLRDVLDSPVIPQGFVGSKPPAWTRWVLDALGYQDADEVVDMFPGSGAVTEAMDGMLAMPIEECSLEAMTKEIGDADE